MKSPSARDPGVLKSAPWSVGSRPWTVFRAHDTRDTASRIMDHAPRFRGPGGGFSSRLRKHREWLPVIARGGSSGWGLGRVLLKWFARQASRFGYHGTRTVGIGRGRHRCLLVPLARIPKRLRFYEDAAKVVQRRMVPNFKKSFERAVRTARR